MAANCVNKNSKEFIRLTMESDMNPTILAAKIALYQDRTGINDTFPTLAELKLNDDFEDQAAKGVELRKIISLDTERGHEQFYSRLSSSERTTDKYLDYLTEELTDTVATTEDKIKRMQQAFDAVVLVDTEMEESGKLLGVNNPISKRNEGKPVIVINPNKLFADTVFHEFGHLYIDLLGGMQDPIVQDAIEFLKGTSLWNKVQDTYPELNAGNLAKEVLATALGIEGDILYTRNAVKRNLWEQIKAAIMKAISAILKKDSSALEKLASEMLNNKTRVSATATFNTLIDQRSKLNISGDVTQKKIDKLFKMLTKRFTLNETLEGGRNYYDEATDISHNKSASHFAKALTGSYYGSQKGDFNLPFNKGFELTEHNFRELLNSATIPMALEATMAEFFEGHIAPEIVRVKDPGEYWHSFWKKSLKATKEAVGTEDYNQSIINNLDLINARAHEIQKENNLPLQAGNAVHKALENYITDGIPFPDNIVDTTSTVASRNQLLFKIIQHIIDTGRANGSKFYSEQMLFSEAASAPGTADLIEITKEGTYRIYDFKTMTTFLDRRLKQKSPWKMYIPNGYLNQVMIYATILQEYGIQPAEDHLNIISIEVDKTDMVEGDLDSIIKIEGVIVDSMTDIASKDRNFANEVKRSNNAVLSAFKTPKRLSNEKEIENEIADIDKLALRLERAIIDYKLQNPNLGETKTLKAFADKIEQYQGKHNKKVILGYINNIRTVLTRVYSSSTSKEEFLSSEYLRDLDFLVKVASFLPDIRSFLTSQVTDYNIDGRDRDELIDLLQETEEALESVIKFQDYKTKEKTVEILVANSNFMEGLWAEKYEMEARKTLGSPTREDIKAYVYKKLKENAAEITKLEFDYWANIFKNGYTDIRYLEYLLADPGMNKSQFVQVAKNVMDKADMDTRMDLDESIADLVSWYNKLSGVKGDPAKTWGKFMETASFVTEEGKRESYMDSSLIPETTSDYRELHMDYKHQLDYYDRLILKAKKENKKTEFDRLITKVEVFKEQRKRDQKKMSKTSRVHPSFAKLSETDKTTLRWIHNKIEKADERLGKKTYSKLSYIVEGQMVYQLPKKRKSGLESAYNAEGALKRFTSGITDYLRPKADEDDMSLTKDEANLIHSDFKTNSSDIVGDPLYEVPIYYRNQLEDPTLQSFDIPTLLAMNEETTIQFEHYSNIEADLFMIVQSLKNTKANKTDNIVNKMIVDRHKGGLAKALRSPDNLVLKAVQASINNRLYKRTYTGVYSNTNYRLIKAAEGLNKVTSMVLLAGNFGSASMTSMQGTIYRFIEGVAGEDFTSADVRTGSRKAWADIHNVIADSQKQFPTSISSLLIRRFGLETQYKALVNKFVQDNFVTKNLDEASVFALTTMAEQIVTSSLMYTLMNNIKVMNTKGDFINNAGKKVARKDAMSLDEAYSVESGKLVLNKHVSYTEHNLITKFRDNINGEKTVAATEISNYIRSKYADLYGQYNQDMKSVAEMHVVGKLAFSMKKWIPRGYHRRWRGINSVKNTFTEMREEANLEKRFYSQDQRKFQEGYYTTGVRYFYTVMQEMKNKELQIGALNALAGSGNLADIASVGVYGLSAAMKNVNATLSTHERANLIRLGSEFAIMAITLAAALLARTVALGMDDDDEHRDKVFFAAYLAERIKTETATFINPFELMNNLENPAAAINTISNVRKLLWQLFGVSYDKDMDEWDWEINNEYTKGERKHQKKVIKRIEALIPFWKKTSQLKGIFGFDSEESIEESYEFMIRNK